MSKKSIIVRQEKRLILVEKYKKTREELKNKIKNVKNIEEKISIQNKIQKLPRNSSRVRLVRNKILF